MTIITPLELADLRRKFARKIENRGHTKPPLNAMQQAIEDWMVSGTMVTPTMSLFAAIDAATTPLGFTFNGAEKKQGVALWAGLRFRKDA